MTRLRRVFEGAAGWLREDPSRWRGGYDCGSRAWRRVDSGTCAPQNLKNPSRARPSVCGACIQGAIALFCSDRIIMDRAFHFLDDEVLEGACAWEWNDERGRTVHEVITALDRAAEAAG